MAKYLRCDKCKKDIVSDYRVLIYEGAQYDFCVPCSLLFKRWLDQ